MEARVEAGKWARGVLTKFERGIRDVDKPHAHAVLTEAGLFELPRPPLEVSVKQVGDVYTITIRGYTGLFDVKRWCEIFMNGDRHELLRRITWTGGQLGVKEHAVIIYMESADATIRSGSGGGGHSNNAAANASADPALRKQAMEFAATLVKTMNVREFDRQWVEAVLIEVIMFEQPTPVLDISLDPVGDLYNITVHGYQNFIDYVRWCNRFLGKNRDKFLSHLVHTWQQTIPERGPCLVLQMERTEFQTTSVATDIFAEPDPPSSSNNRSRSKSRSRHRSKTPARHGSRSQSKKRTE